MNNIDFGSLYFTEITKCNYDAINGVANFVLNTENNNVVLRFTGVSKYMFIQSKSNTFDDTVKFFPIEDIIENDVAKSKEFQLIEKKHKKVFEEFQYNYLIDSCCSCWYINAEHVELLSDL